MSSAHETFRPSTALKYPLSIYIAQLYIYIFNIDVIPNFQGQFLLFCLIIHPTDAYFVHSTDIYLYILEFICKKNQNL